MKHFSFICPLFLLYCSVRVFRKRVLGVNPDGNNDFLILSNPVYDKIAHVSNHVRALASDESPCLGRKSMVRTEGSIDGCSGKGRR